MQTTKTPDKEKKAPRQKLAEAVSKFTARLWDRNPVQIPDTVDEKQQYTSPCQWDIIDKIEPETIVAVVRSALVKRNCAYSKARMFFLFYNRSEFNKSFVVQTRNPDSHKLECWAVKIPGCGTPDVWNAEYAQLLTQEVQTLGLIATYANVPAPVVIDHSPTLDNTFGFPYIVTTDPHGQHMGLIWFDEPGVPTPPEKEQGRLTCLRSLARQMTELDKLQFAQIGAPMFDPHTAPVENCKDIEAERLPVGPCVAWPYSDSHETIMLIGPFPSIQALVQAALAMPNNFDLRDKPGSLPSFPLTRAQYRDRGTAKFLSILLAHPSFHSSPTETFVLTQPHLDADNVFISPSGTVTAILGWENVIAGRRCTAHASAPSFLEEDWTFAPGWPMFPSWRAPYYRTMWAAALVEAGNSDAQVASKSHICDAISRVLWNNREYTSWLLTRVVCEMGLQVSVDELVELLGMGCVATENMLREKVDDILRPEMPPEGFLEHVEAQIADAIVREWMAGFDGLLE
ncbi:hypothetical protein C7974DRAFT_115172 [Boeremia exigua]|uniref:uncharacterized protein n=1 Tax=Boeremia exigua TaxID=749465 RepID=UPI001E8CD936|nr:uncharacterized protein C7974DRAFT_115172 [Boeremia exigua]KAH6643032.1 hypothetical protein C7974DRAFT_115172 [Boeremia exigua]